METLLIADDEKIVIESLRFIIDKYFPDEFQLFTAKSGREAVLLAEQNRIDIALLDISMPGITGIQAIEQMRNTRPDMVCIILTAFDKFDYAKTALHLGVFEYLLKPIRREKIVEVLRAARQKVESNKRQRRYELDINEKLEKAHIMFEKELISGLVCSHISREDLYEHMRILNLEDISGYFMLLEFDNSFAERIGIEQGPVEVVGERYHRVRDCIKKVGDYYMGSLLSGRVILLRMTKNEYSDSLLCEEAEKIRKKLWQTLQTQVHVGIGHFITEASQACSSYSAAKLALCFTNTNKPIICYEEIRDENKEWEDASVGRPIQQAVAYIDQNYNQNLTLDLLADFVNISPNYLSKLFKEEVGRSFIDYLTYVRIEKAKLLLKQNKWSIKEIAIAVGYKDAGYFTRIFKKITGFVPTDYV